MVLLVLMFLGGVSLGAGQVLSTEGQMPPEEKYKESLTKLPESKEEIIAYLNSAVDFAELDKAKLDVKTEISVEDDSISFGENGELFEKSFIYAKDSILSNISKKYSSGSVDFGKDFSAMLWNLDFNKVIIEKAESKEEGENYAFKIMFPNEDDPFSLNGIVNDRFHMKDSEKVIGYLWESQKGFAAIENVKVSCSNLEIDTTVNRLEDKISNITYFKKFNIEADITFSGELSSVGTRKMSFALQEKTVFDFTWANLALSPKTMKMEKGDIKVVSALITASGDIKVKWASSNPEVAEVDIDGYVKGRKVSAEPVIITADMEFLGKKFTDTCEVYVTVPVTRVNLSEKKIVLAMGETKMLQSSVKPKDATIKDVLWYTNNPAVAVVDDKGNITGVARGKTEIYVLSKDGYYKTSCAVTVTG